MFGDESSRAGRDQATLTPLGIKSEVLEDDPHLRTKDTQQIPGVRPHNHAAPVGRGFGGHHAGTPTAAGERSRTASVSPINRSVGIRF